MAILVRLFQFLFWLVVATWIGGKVLGWLFSGPAPDSSAAPQAQRRPLFRDPWCGTHIPAEISFPLDEAGRVVHFCSPECREGYQTSRRRASA